LALNNNHSLTQSLAHLGQRGTETRDTTYYWLLVA